MKTMNVSAYLFGGIALVNTIFFSSCTSEDQDLARAEYVAEIRVTGEDVVYVEEGQTRTAYQFSSGKVGFQWATGDTLGIYPIGADQVSFPISSGDGSSSAAFDGGAWALRSTYQYAAYYPFTAKNYHIDQKSIPVSYLGQKQIGNSSMDNLAPYDYQAAAPTQPTATGGVNLAMKHLGAFMRLRLNIPEASTITSVTIRSDKAKFVTKGTFDLTSSSPAITPTEASSELTLALESVTTTSANQDIIVWMLVAPVDMSSSTLTISAMTRTGKLFENTKAGMNLQAGTCYGFVVSLNKDANESTYAYGHEYVDLGLPSGLRWASLNVGATVPEEYGDYFSWGEIEPKASYTPSSYLHSCSEDVNSIEGRFDNLEDIKGTDYDVARQKWGGSWRMPTDSEFRELTSCCSWKWCTINSVYGYRVTGPNGHWIFLPAAGSRYDSDLRYNGEDGYYWSATTLTNEPICALYLSFNERWKSVEGWISYDWRIFGQSVRPVIE